MTMFFRDGTECTNKHTPVKNREIDGKPFEKSALGHVKEMCDVCEEMFSKKDLVFVEGIHACENCVK